MVLRVCTQGLLHRIVSFRCFSSGASGNNIALTDDESTFVAWHPKQDFPYECTKPLPKKVMSEDTSVLKTHLTPELMSVINKKPAEQARLELMNITHTTKHRWFPRSSRRSGPKRAPMDRQYL